ncbi:glutathione S-transferase family protein, partial [Cyanobacteria bacterium FACHB-63]|nr:glutathione S-transferase family protein [Cyanobacteria bacterium FACHB-63]
VPLLKVDDEVLFESAVICEYLDEITPGSLHPADPLERAKHRAWIEFGSSILNMISGFYSASSKDLLEQKQQELLDKFTWIERHGLGEPYFAGEVFSLVDAVYAPIFRYFDVFETFIGRDFFANTPTVKLWRQALQSHPHVKSAVVEDYSQRLLTFLQQRRSYLSTLILQ